MDTLESRMSAVRARISNLSSIVEQKESDRFWPHRAVGHGCFTEEHQKGAALSQISGERTNSSPPWLSSEFSSRPTIPDHQVQRESCLMDRDVNQLHSVTNSNVSLGHQIQIRNPSTSINRACANKPASGVMTMLHLARHHAAASTCGDPAAKETILATSSAMKSGSPSARSPSPDVLGVRPSHVKVDPSQNVVMPGGATGLYSYRLEERFLCAREPTASLTLTEQASTRHSNERGTPYSRAWVSTHGLATGTPIDEGRNPNAETSFDAFRVVQERLREKVKQLTVQPPECVTQRSGKDVTSESVATGEAFVTPTQQPVRDDPKHLSSVDRDGSSPSPRPPRSVRSATATPMRSIEERGALSDDRASSPLEGSPDPCGKRDASMDAKVYSDDPQRALEWKGKTNIFIPSSTRRLVVDGGDDATVVAHPSWSSAKRVATSRVAHSDPTGCPATNTRGPSAEDHLTYAPRQQKCCPREYEKRSVATAEQCSHSGRRQSQRTAAATLNGELASLRRSGSRRVSSSMSAARSSATRDGNISRVARPHTSAHKKPISLNVEATILCFVSGAELLALLRMRGLIESEGDTGEYRLPPNRCHRLYVTHEEHRQLKLLRQSLHFLEDEEKRQCLPSYQRVTVSARSRNTELVSPPHVLRYMDI